jgi:hypothetical protein
MSTTIFAIRRAVFHHRVRLADICEGKPARVEARPQLAGFDKALRLLQDVAVMRPAFAGQERQAA